MKTVFFLCGFSLALFFPRFVFATCPIQNSHDFAIVGWPVDQIFKVRADYPSALPAHMDRPWLKLDFKENWQAYLQSVLAYVLEGNEDQGVDWYAQRNTKRSWYHALWMERSHSGREFVHGLTRERTTRDHDLSPFSKGKYQSWAVSAYNAVGAYTLGQVWKNPCDPDLGKAHFHEGTVAYKLIFTTASPDELPFLQNTKKWKAHVLQSVDQVSTQTHQGLKNAHPFQRVQQPIDVFLIQLDIAIRDDRSVDTGWVFGTFVYQSDAPGFNVFDRMVPAALQWGNDPDKKPGELLHQSKVNKDLFGRHFGWDQRLWLGWYGRANGPIDNQGSSCMSCHGSAQFPRSIVWGNVSSFKAGHAHKPILSDAQVLAVYFRNIQSGNLFDATTSNAKPLDYSLQIQVGVERMCDAFKLSLTGTVNTDLLGLPIPKVCL